MKEVSFPATMAVAMIMMICFSIPVLFGMYNQHLRYLASLKEKRPGIEIHRPKDDYENLDV